MSLQPLEQGQTQAQELGWLTAVLLGLEAAVARWEMALPLPDSALPCQTSPTLQVLTFLHSGISEHPAGVGLCPGPAGGNLD